MDTRTCKVCETEKPIDEFSYIKSNSQYGKEGYYRWQCKPCERARIRKQYHENAEYHRTRNRKYHHEVRHGLGEGRYDSILESQGGVCAICKATSPGGNRKYFAIDHDHACCPGMFGCGKCVRGLLCGSCNMSLGGFKDNVEVLEAAIEYLRLVSK